MTVSAAALGPDASSSAAPKLDRGLLVQQVTKEFGAVTALRDVSLEIGQGEFVTLLGPSGCGKTTLLRILAGFEQPDSGRVVLDGNDLARRRPHVRPMNMVFQRPCLFPHLDVFGNVAFGLRLEKLKRSEIRQRVSDALGMVRLEGFETRRAHEMSGGQLQRVSLARAIVKRPRVLLLDEPLSALDLRIRLEMEGELRRLHRELGATFVYVTHDQREALALSDRLAVFDHGVLQQVGTPQDVYDAPGSPFAARFVGDANVLAVEVLRATGEEAVVRLADQDVIVRGGARTATGPAWLVIRPELARLRAPGIVKGVVRDVAFRGTGYAYRIAVTGIEELLKVESATNGNAPQNVGATVEVGWESCQLLPREPHE